MGIFGNQIVSLKIFCFPWSCGKPMFCNCKSFRFWGIWDSHFLGSLGPTPHVRDVKSSAEWEGIKCSICRHLTCYQMAPMESWPIEILHEEIPLRGAVWNLQIPRLLQRSPTVLTLCILDLAFQEGGTRVACHAIRHRTWLEILAPCKESLDM